MPELQQTQDHKPRMEPRIEQDGRRKNHGVNVEWLELRRLRVERCDAVQKQVLEGTLGQAVCPLTQGQKKAGRAKG